MVAYLPSVSAPVAKNRYTSPTTAITRPSPGGRGTGGWELVGMLLYFFSMQNDLRVVYPCCWADALICRRWRATARRSNSEIRHTAGRVNTDFGYSRKERAT